MMIIRCELKYSLLIIIYEINYHSVGYYFELIIELLNGTNFFPDDNRIT